MGFPIHLDHQATTPVLPRVREAMPRWYDAHPVEAGRAALQRARAQIRTRFGAPQHRVVFTGGATESNTLAIEGTLRARGGGHVVTVATEHASVLATVRRAADRVTVVPVASDGRVDPADVARAIEPDTVLVSVMTVQNEIGVLQDLWALAAVCRNAEVPFHTDAAQTVFTDLIADAGVDLVSISGHKMGAPQGIGALLVRQDHPLEPVLVGGGQQEGLRSGTVPVALAVALGEAAATSMDRAEVARHRDLLAGLLTEGFPGLRWNGSRTHRAPHNLNVVLPGVDTSLLVTQLAGRVTVSTGAACSAGLHVSSHVIEALGVTGRDRSSVLRASVGWCTTEAGVRTAAAAILAAVGRPLPA